VGKQILFLQEKHTGKKFIGSEKKMAIEKHGTH
jgi:hypothetical protein